MQRVHRQPDATDDGYMLVACIILVFLITLALSVAAPTVARGLEHEKELEAQHRAQQYVRALRVYYRKNNNYPTSIDQLKLTNNQRYLRQEYLDPLTGKADWRIIHVGENKTKVKGFFGQDLPGIAGAIGGSGIGSPIGGTPAGASGSGASIGSTGSSSGIGSSFGSGSSSGSSIGSSFGSGSTSGSSFGSGSATGSGIGSSGTTGSGSTSSSNSSSTGSGVGPIMGIGVGKSGQAILAVNGEDHFENWEFLYDPRIEQLYAKGALNAGIGSGSATGTGSGLPAPPPGFSGAPTSGFGGAASSGFGGATTPGQTSPPPPTAPPPPQ